MSDEITRRIARDLEAPDLIDLLADRPPGVIRLLSESDALGFTCYRVEREALKIGSRYLGEDLLALDLRKWQHPCPDLPPAASISPLEDRRFVDGSSPYMPK